VGAGHLGIDRTLFVIAVNKFLIILLTGNCLFFLHPTSRNLVSASQDGKLIVWDGYTTNKVCDFFTMSLIDSNCIIHVVVKAHTLLF
jgi:hypothetical protein